MFDVYWGNSPYSKMAESFILEGGMRNAYSHATTDTKVTVRKDLTQLLSESVDLKDFHDKMALYFNEEE